MKQYIWMMVISGKLVDGSESKPTIIYSPVLTFPNSLWWLRQYGWLLKASPQLFHFLFDLIQACWTVSRVLANRVPFCVGKRVLCHGVPWWGASAERKWYALLRCLHWVFMFVFCSSIFLFFSCLWLTLLCISFYSLCFFVILLFLLVLYSFILCWYFFESSILFLYSTLYSLLYYLFLWDVFRISEVYQLNFFWYKTSKKGTKIQHIR